jgi:hypothetical protein
MKPLPFIVLGIYIMLFVIIGLIFGFGTVGYLLLGMAITGTFLYIAILAQEKPWKYALPWENTLAYAAMAYGAVYLGLPIIVLNIVEDMQQDGKIDWRWLK